MRTFVGLIDLALSASVTTLTMADSLGAIAKDHGLLWRTTGAMEDR